MDSSCVCVCVCVYIYIYVCVCVCVYIGKMTSAKWQLWRLDPGEWQLDPERVATIWI